MSSQIKVNILLVGELEKSREGAPRAWLRKTLQVFTGEIAGNIPCYGTEEELNAITTGYAMVEVAPRAADRGRLEFALGKVTPVIQGKAAQA